MPPPLDFFARSTWASLNETGLGTTWQQYVSGTPLAATCPKVGIGFFFSSSRNTNVRGAKALAPIAKGEVICKVPISSMLSEFSVGNSTLRSLAAELEREALISSPPPPPPPPRKRAKQRARDDEPLGQPVLNGGLLDQRALMVLLVLRETARDRSPSMPYYSLVRSHNVDGVPSLWPLDSERFRTASPLLQSMGRASRSRMHALYKNMVPMAIQRFAPELSEGLGCTGLRGQCDASRLEALYSYDNFAHLFAILAARDWVLPVYGQHRPFLVPVMDMLNFGQVGIRAHFDDEQHAFIATASQPIQMGTELLFRQRSMCKEAWDNLYGFGEFARQHCGPRLGRATRGATPIATPHDTKVKAALRRAGVKGVRGL